MPEHHSTEQHKRAILDWRSQYMSDGNGAIAALDYMARHDYELDDEATGGTRAYVEGDLGRLVVEVNDGGSVDVYVLDRHGVYIWGASATEFAPKSLALDMIQLGEMSAKVAGQPAQRKAKACKPWSLACTSTDGQYAAGAKSHYSHR